MRMLHHTTFPANLKEMAKRFSLLLFALALFGTMPQPAHSGDNIWTNQGPYGARAQSIAIDPSNSSIVYVGTNDGSLFKSTNGGATWSFANTGLPEGDVFAIAIDPTTTSTLYAALSGQGVFKSTDGGATWNASSTGITSIFLSALAIDPSTPSTLYLGTTSGGVFKSTDSGANWSAINNGISTTDVRSLAIDPSTPATLYAGTWGSGVFKSTDSGANWTAFNTNLTNLFVNALAIDPSTPATLYAGTGGGGVFKSTDSGANWSAINTGMGSQWVNALVFDPTSSSTLYAGTNAGGVFKSTDSGANWSAINAGISTADIRSLAVSSSAVFAGTNIFGVFKSTDGGANWSESNNGVAAVRIRSLAVDPVTSTIVYAGSERGVYKSTDGGATWNLSNNGMGASNTWAIAIDPSTTSTLYAGTSSGVFKSTDAGANWSAINTGLTTTFVRSLAIDPATPATLYAGTNTGGVFKSIDGGANWSSSNSGGPASIYALVVDPTTPSTLYLATFGNVYKSINSGGSWSVSSTGITATANFSSLAIDPLTTSTLYVGTGDGGVFKSTNSGVNWSATNTGLTDPDVQALAVDPVTPSMLYAGTYTGGVFKSADGGANWNALNTGLSKLRVAALAIDPLNPNKLYAGTQGGSAWDITQSIGPPTSDLFVTVKPSSLNGWAHGAESGAGTVDFINGPGTPPLNSGSAQFSLVDGTSGVALGTSNFPGTKLADIYELQYSTYNSFGNNTVAPALQINIDYDLTDATTSWQGRLVFEPYYDNVIVDGTWQTWDALAGRWWQTGTPVVGDAPAAQLYPISSPGSLSDILAAYPNAGVQTGALSGILFKAGSAWLSGYQGSVDEFIIRVTDTRTTFDFEPDGPATKPYLILANENVKFDGTLLSDGDIHSNGDIAFHNDEKGTHTGNLSAVKDITIDKGVTIDGDATAKRIYEFGDITGTVTDKATVAEIPLPVLNFTAGGPDKTAPKKGSLTLAPGTYGKVKVEKKSTLYLSSGDYFMDELDTDNFAKVVIDVSGGPVNINVVKDLEIDDAVEIVIDPGGDSNSDLLTFSTMQKNKVDIGKYTKVLGNIIAPKAEVHFSDESQFRGTVCAEKVTVEEGVPFLHHNSPQSLPKRVVPDYVDDDDAIAEVVPTVYDLSQNYPNPFNPTTVIRYQLAASAEVKLSIYNTTGQLVRTLVNGEMPAGSHAITWDATDNSGQRVASGVYLYIIRAGDAFVQQRKLILMK